MISFEKIFLYRAVGVWLAAIGATFDPQDNMVGQSNESTIFDSDKAQRRPWFSKETIEIFEKQIGTIKYLKIIEINYIPKVVPGMRKNSLGSTYSA